MMTLCDDVVRIVEAFVNPDRAAAARRRFTRSVLPLLDVSGNRKHPWVRHAPDLRHLLGEPPNMWVVRRRCRATGGDGRALRMLLRSLGVA